MSSPDECFKMLLAAAMEKGVMLLHLSEKHKQKGVAEATPFYCLSWRT